MKLQILQENLAKALSTSSRFVNTRAQLPILSNILLSASKNKLSVQATNLEISANLSIGAKIENEGVIAVPVKVIVDLVSNLSKETLTLELDKEILKIESKGFSGTIIGMNASDFPVIPTSVGKRSIQISKEILVQMLSKVLFAVSIDETRPVLTGILFVFSPDELSLVATDGFRLSHITKKLENKNIEVKRLILPKNILSELTRISDREGESIFLEVREADNQVVFGLSETVLGSRIIQGEFPNFEKIIPQTSNVKLSLDKEEFLRAIKLASVFAKDNANIIKLSIAEEGLSIFSESSKSGSQKMDIEAKVEGQELEITYNYRFIEEFLNVVEGEEVQMEFSDSSAPGIFRDPKDPNFLHLIMPVRIQS